MATCGTFSISDLSQPIVLDLLTGYGSRLRVRLQEYPSLVRHLIANVEPFLLVGMIDLHVFDNVVRVDEVAWLQVFDRINGLCGAQSKRPVFHWPIDRLPYATIIQQSPV
jgi:hypothetical protein